ncbi:MAG: DUF2877 domain-containing protein [Actinomycetota bacterium]
MASVRRRALRAGAGAVETLTAGGEGRVLAWFPRACYLEGSGGLVTLVGPGVHDGPLYLVLDGDLPRFDAGTSATLSPDTVELPGWTVDVTDATPWRGGLLEPDRIGAAAGSVADAAAEVAGGALLPRAGFEARPLVERGELEAAAALLAGLGPGLTPSGDDVLGGVLFARRILAGSKEESRLAAVAESVRTNTIARAFLRWAARGQALSPVHDLVAAAVHGDDRQARGAARALAAVGESSGADFALGLRWGIVVPSL